MKTQLISMILFFSILTLWGCDRDSKSYYPLKEGREWEYQLSGSIETMKVSVTNLVVRELKGKKVIPQQQADSFTFIVDDATGVYEFAEQSATDVDPTIHEQPRYLIKYPIEVGKGWESQAETSLLLQKVPLTLKSTIESKDDVVTVPAGNFKGCLKIKSIGSTKMNLGAFMGTANINVEHWN